MAKWAGSIDTAREVVEHFNNTEGATVRSTAKACDMPKTNVHYILTEVLPNETSIAKLEKNKKEAPYRGGEATRRKYRRE